MTSRPLCLNSRRNEKQARDFTTAGSGMRWKDDEGVQNDLGNEGANEKQNSQMPNELANGTLLFTVAYKNMMP